MTPEEKNEVLKELREKIHQETRNEVECAKSLKKVAWILLPDIEESLYYVKSEQSCSSGRIDMLVLAETQGVGGRRQRILYIWELKAPQLHLFDSKKENMACPSSYLYEAENQLLHYYYTTLKDGNLLKTYEVSENNVKFGGIIIGRDNNFVLCREIKPKIGRNLAMNALDIRKQFFYDSNSIKLLTWDIILKKLEIYTLSHQKYSGDPRFEIKPNRTASLNVSGSGIEEE